ncbi:MULTISPECIES: 4-hydroxy-tetrahydrodipicolinate synthase [Chromobacterium]|uniref:4-hydroxy-tetrahydrodipicolinate synthase n=1 Tax=Chromobacterium TaxID=535 RepID=UPI0018885A31|nr:MULTISPECIES: 4-hydroxy-tetrahydrodipicolinate synthase [Chromobacterium]QOZ83891.1 4-hydroxy-tetrahydrodipicolinate synthase [Chromobacterium sp. Rain0013]WON84032.1 4-hydroxy-tetrahydrodipicolinate synthase [Chromobacterium haemolyticum]
MTEHWGKVLTAMVTPFDEAGRLNLDAARQLARHLAANGSDGLVVAATTGEAPTLSDQERRDLVRAVSEAVTIPVLAGTGSSHTEHAIALTREASDLGAAGVFVVGPYYNRPPQAGIEAHFRAVAAATRLPLMVYDVPGRTGRRIAADVLLRLFREVDNIVAFKDATGDPAAAAALVATAGEHFTLYSGDDALTLPLLAVGAVGVVGTSTHWTGPEFTRMIAAFEQGDTALARRVNAGLQESFAFSNTDASVFSMSVKAMLRVQGLPVGQCRLPLPPTGAAEEEQARLVWERLQLRRAAAY